MRNTCLLIFELIICIDRECTSRYPNVHPEGWSNLIEIKSQDSRSIAENASRYKSNLRTCKDSEKKNGSVRLIKASR